MQTQRAEYALVPHQAHPPLGVSAVLARVLGVEGPWLQLRWRIEGAGRLVVPRFAGRGRAASGIAASKIATEPPRRRVQAQSRRTGRFRMAWRGASKS